MLAAAFHVLYEEWRLRPFGQIWGATMRSLKSLLLVAAAGALLILAAFPLSAQTTLGTIIGEVTDPTGAVLPEVDIAVRNMATNIEHRTRTGENGLYQVTNLVPGRYSVTAQRAGFRSLTLSEVTLETATTARANIRLAVGDLTTRVTVEASAPVINTEGAEVANVRTNRMMLQSPVNYRGDSASGFYSVVIVLTQVHTGRKGPTSVLQERAAISTGVRLMAPTWWPTSAARCLQYRVRWTRPRR